MNKLSPGAIQVELRRARESFARGDMADASRRAAYILRASPTCGEAYLVQGAVFLAEGRDVEALSSLVPALLYVPKNADALRFASICCLNLNKGAEAETYARRLTQVDSKDAGAYFLLSSALCLVGRFQDALEEVEHALALQPANLEYTLAKAQLLSRLQFAGAAIEWYKKALEIQPLADTAFDLAYLLMDESRIDEASELLDRFVPQLPVESRPHALIARVYTESQRFDEAEPHWTFANRFSPNREGLIRTRATSEIFAGRLNVAEDLLREAQEREPSAPLFCLLTTAVKISTRDVPLIEKMEQLASKSLLDEDAKRDLNYALGKSYHDLGEYGKASAFFDEANRIRYETSPALLAFDREQWRARIDTQITLLTEKNIRELVNQGLESHLPLFVVGMIRSGTTLFEQILSCHSRIAGGGERSYWGDHSTDVLNPTSGNFDVAMAKLLGKKYLATMGALRMDGTEYVIDKNPSNILVGGTIHSVFPNAKFIHVKRNAVDNLLSIWMTPMKTGLPFVGNRDNLVFAYREYLRLARHLENVLPKTIFRTFSYEQITSRPEATVGGMLQFLSLEPEPGCLYPERNPRSVRTPSAYQVRQRINTDSQEKWRHYEPWLGAFAELLGE